MNKPKKRKDSFFGVHFDFHAMLGQVVAYPARPDLIGKMLDAVKPDYVQIDTKGHPGLSSYPTVVGNQASDIRVDMLKIWREETRKRGIALYGHHSGIFDMKAIELHPEYAVVDKDGNASDSFTGIFSDYAEDLLIPQIKELASVYELDGIWVDGECWGLRIDYSDNAKKAYGKEIPKPDEECFEEYCDFTRQSFEKYVENYINQVKKEHPDFQMTSNWIYSHYMTEKPSVAVDFISGDYACYNAVESARYTGRFLYLTGLPWDLMSWGQNAKKCHWAETDRTVKEYEQYCQEAAMIISLGGGFEFFNIIYGGGGCLQEWCIPTWEKVAKFCREREETCYKSTLIHETGILDNHNYTNTPDRTPYIPKYLEGVRGWINAFQDTQHSTEIIAEHQTTKEFLSKFKLIVMPSATDWNNDTLNAVKEYIKNGGIAIVECNSNIELFGDEFTTEKDKLIFIDGKGTLASLRTEYFSPLSFDEEDVCSKCYTDNIYFDEYERPLAIRQKYGKGTVIKLLADIGKKYNDNKTSAIKRFIDSLVEYSGAEFDVCVTGSRYAEVVLAEKDGNKLVNIINLAGNHALMSERTFEEIPPIGPLNIILRSARKPSKVLSCPDGAELDYTYSDGKIQITLDKVHIHTVVKAEY